MNLFIYEHLTSGASAADALPRSLLAEGDSMLQAVLRDLHALGGYHLMTLRDQSLDELPFDNCETYRVTGQSSYDHHWHQCLKKADAVWLIAPESDGILARLQASVITAGVAELGCAPVITAQCSDKLKLATVLSQHGFHTVPGQTLANYHQQPLFNARELVIKPRDGAGCLDTYRLDAGTDLSNWLNTEPERWLVQPYLAGTAISLNAFFSDKTATLLSRNHQQVHSRNNQLTVTASVPATDGESVINSDIVQQLLLDIQQTLPGLWGFVGIDLLDTDKGLLIVEINPRVTSSYPAISATTGLNPCRLLSQHLHEKLNKGFQ